jgi:hypothetical protein
MFQYLDEIRISFSLSSLRFSMFSLAKLSIRWGIQQPM